jgi:hypothetical protein
VHLSILRRGGIVAVRRDGAHVHDRLTLPEVTAPGAAMREMLDRSLAAREERPRAEMASRAP